MCTGNREGLDVTVEFPTPMGANFPQYPCEIRVNLNMVWITPLNELGRMQLTNIERAYAMPLELDRRWGIPLAHLIWIEDLEDGCLLRNYCIVEGIPRQVFGQEISKTDAERLFDGEIPVAALWSNYFDYRMNVFSNLPSDEGSGGSIVGTPNSDYYMEKKQTQRRNLSTMVMEGFNDAHFEAISKSDSREIFKPVTKEDIDQLIRFIKKEHGGKLPIELETQLTNLKERHDDEIRNLLRNESLGFNNNLDKEGDV